MKHAAARTLLLALIFALVISLPGSGPFRLQSGEATVIAHCERTVFLGGEMSDVERIAFTSALAAAHDPGVVLFDTPRSEPHLARFLKQFSATSVQPIGRFANEDQLGARLDVRTWQSQPFRNGHPEDLWRMLFPKAERVVVCMSKPYSLLLQAAVLAAATEAPLYIYGQADSGLNQWLVSWHAREVVFVGEVPDLLLAEARKLESPPTVTRLTTEADVRAAYLAAYKATAPIKNLVVTNPNSGEWSSLAPWLAAQKHAALVLTDKTGRDVEKAVEAATREPALQSADCVILLGGHDAIPKQFRPNPIAGKDSEIAMEPLTPEGTAPFSYAVGRMFGGDHGVLALQIARQRLMSASASHTALVVSNAGGGLPLLETVSRHTSQELRYCGFETQTMFGNSVVAADIRQQLPGADLFLWEGHHNTLVKDYGFTEWNEPLKPSLIILQSCLALTEEKALPLLERGAIGVIGSSTRTYSASGGAFSLSFIDGMLYDHQTFGGGLRQAKNFLATYQVLKEKRLKQTKLSGANLRSSWAFTLWGDPTLQLPLPERPANNQGAVHARLVPAESDDASLNIVVDAPDASFDRVRSGKYQADMQPNTRLAGLIRAGEKEESHLVSFRFAEVELPQAPAGKTPHLHGNLPDDCWAFCWDERRRAGYLLILPRAKDIGALRFRVDWDAHVAPGP